MIRFVKVSTSAPVVQYRAETLKGRLSAGESVLWLVSGGSCIPVAIAVARALQGVDVRHLTVTLTDERYGAVGHDDSNWQQLTAGGFTLPPATMLKVLDDSSRSDTAKDWERAMEDQLQTAKFRLGLFGMGPDGHTAGILPHSSAVSATGLVTDFAGPDYERITITPDAIALLDMAVVYAVGEAKKGQLEQLQTDVLPDDQPAQYLKSVQQVTVFTDQMGDPA